MGKKDDDMHKHTQMCGRTNGSGVKVSPAVHVFSCWNHHSLGYAVAVSSLINHHQVSDRHRVGYLSTARVLLYHVFYLFIVCLVCLAFSYGVSCSVVCNHILRVAVFCDFFVAHDVSASLFHAVPFVCISLCVLFCTSLGCFSFARLSSVG